MKIAILLLVLGLVIGIVVPYYLRDIYGGGGIQFSQFFWSKSPPKSISFDFPAVLRVLGIILGILAIIRFIAVPSTE